MRALDTNVIVRHLVYDDAKQGERATQILEAAESANDPLLVTDLVVLELIWVLRKSYAFTRGELLEALALLATMPALRFESHEMITSLLARGYSSNAHLDDLLIGLRAAACGCDATVTFEKGLPRTRLFELA